MGKHYQPDIFAYLKAGDSDLKSLVKSRLRFLALTRSETNVFFNPHDGRRLCDTRGVYNDNDCVHDDDRLLDVPCDDLDRKGDAESEIDAAAQSKDSSESDVNTSKFQANFSKEAEGGIVL